VLCGDPGCGEHGKLAMEDEDVVGTAAQRPGHHTVGSAVMVQCFSQRPADERMGRYLHESTEAIVDGRRYRGARVAPAAACSPPSRRRRRRAATARHR
jgi:hypothetical protein